LLPLRTWTSQFAEWHAGMSLQAAVVWAVVKMEVIAFIGYSDDSYDDSDSSS